LEALYGDGVNQAAMTSLHFEVAQFLFQEARLLDETKLDQWLALFADDAFYWIPAHVDQTDPFNHISILYEDRSVLALRVERLKHPRAYSSTPFPRAARMVGNVMVTEDIADSHSIVAKSTLFVAEYRAGERLLRACLATHHLRRTSEGLRIVLKRVDLIDAESPPGLITVPL
jgi:3-phenylpropionate/cinnamic acid dioxygenase small subunit